MIVTRMLYVATYLVVPTSVNVTTDTLVQEPNVLILTNAREQTPVIPMRAAATLLVHTDAPAMRDIRAMRLTAVTSMSVQD